MDLQPNKTDAVVKPITETRISASEWNQLVGSCMEFITAAGFTPDAEDNQQFLNAFIQIAQNLGAIGANVDLSNLSATGEAHFDNTYTKTDLSNLTNTGSEKVAHITRPGDYSTALTLPAADTATEFTAPADGYVDLQVRVSAAGNEVGAWYKSSVEGSNSFVGSRTYATGSNQLLLLFVPVAKGEKFNVFVKAYSSNTSSNRFRFVYAKGAN